MLILLLIEAGSPVLVRTFHPDNNTGSEAKGIDREMVVSAGGKKP